MFGMARTIARSTIAWWVEPAWPKEVPEWVAMIFALTFC
jgi:hypothetical protein